MLNDLPTELLLNVLSYLDNLDPLAASNPTLSAAVGDYQASQLRRRLARIRYVDLLMGIWSPPTFFRPRSRRGGTVHVSRNSRELFNILRDPEMAPRVEAYLDSLERKAYVVERVADHLCRLGQFQGFRSGSERISYASTLVIHLWSAQQRYGHDRDGYISTLRDDCTLADVIAGDRYLASQPAEMRAWLVSVYNTMSQHLRPPFRRGEGMWLYRLIVRDGMEAILGMLEQRGH